VELFLQRLFNAFENGAIYGALALSLAIVYRSTRHLNFAQGEMAMFGAFLTYVLSVEQGWPVWLALLAAMTVSAVFGAGVERVLVRPLERRSPLAVVIVTLGVFLVLNSAASDIWYGLGKQFDSPFPAKTTDRAITIGGAKLYHATIGFWVALGLAYVLLQLLLTRTKTGLAFRAVSSNRESAEFVGINVGRTVMIGWALAGAVGTLAGVIEASRRGTIDPNFMHPVLIYAFAAVTLGGFDSLGGALIGGVGIALAETMISGYVSAIGGDLAQGTALAVIIVVLLFRPNGLYGSRRVARV
jgi:branched-chain amino acid transport system permease protein